MKLSQSYKAKVLKQNLWYRFSTYAYCLWAKCLIFGQFLRPLAHEQYHRQNYKRLSIGFTQTLSRNYADLQKIGIGFRVDIISGCHYFLYRLRHWFGRLSRYTFSE